MNRHCTITLMRSDSKPFVDGLVDELRKDYETVELLALGTSHDVDVLNDIYDSVVTLLDIDNKFADSELIVSSLDASMEVNSHVEKFAKVMFWFDPVLDNSQECSKLVEYSAASGLAEVVPQSIAAMTPAGEKAWNATAPGSIQRIESEFACADLSQDADALIEKKSRLRILIDGSSNINNHYLVDAFIVLDKRDDIEVWCVFDGELKSWMRPDFQINSIRRSELDIYAASVDAVIAAGSKVSEQTIADYLAVGLVPIVLDKSTNSVLANIEGYDALKQNYPNIGSELVLERLLESKDALSSYNAMAEKFDTTNVYFNYSQVKGLFEGTSKLASYFSSASFSKIKEEYFLQRYDDTEGSSYHKYIEVNSRIVSKQAIQEIQEIRVSGWAVDRGAKVLCGPVVWSNNNRLSTVLRRHNRPDVDDYFELNGMCDLGFVSKSFESADDIDVEELKYAISDNKDGCVKANTIIEDIDLSISSEDTQNINLAFVEGSEIEGCIETLTFNEAGYFNISEFGEKLAELEFRIRRDEELIDPNAIEVYVGSEDKISRISSISQDGVIDLPESDTATDHLTLYVSSESTTLENITLIVSRVSVDESESAKESANDSASAAVEPISVDSKIAASNDDIETSSSASSDDGSTVQEANAA